MQIKICLGDISKIFVIYFNTLNLKIMSLKLKITIRNALLMSVLLLSFSIIINVLMYFLKRGKSLQTGASLLRKITVNPNLWQYIAEILPYVYLYNEDIQ